MAEQLKGYWFQISTTEVIDVTLSSHIRAVIQLPEKFGLTIEMIRDIYQEYMEPLGCEGKARREIILKILKNTDWVRLREYADKTGHWVTANIRFPDEKENVIKAFNFPLELYRWDLLHSKGDSI